MLWLYGYYGYWLLWLYGYCSAKLSAYLQSERLSP